MIVRLDEFPWMSPGPGRSPGSWDMLLALLDALRAPCCLAVVLPGDGLDGATMAEIERLQSFPDLTLAMHGVGHRRLACESAGQLARLRQMLGQEPAIAIPPCNHLTQDAVTALVAAGYKFVCTGPETYRGCPDLKIEGIREVPSAWYGKLRERDLHGQYMEPFDCVTFHTGWEDFSLIAEFADQNRDSILSWSELDA